MPHHSARRLSRKPLAPVLGCQPPANFDRRREIGLKLWQHQPNKPDEFTRPDQFRRERTKPMPVEMAFNPSNQRIGFLRRQQSRKEFHHPRVCIYQSKRQPIFRAPSPENQSLCLEDNIHLVVAGPVTGWVEDTRI